MVRTRQTASLQLSRTPWTRRRKRKIWRAKRIKAARSATGLFRTVVEETPAAMRRRLLLERAAYQLAHTGLSVADVALDANYGSLEAFTRAFRKAFRTSPSIYRRMRDPHFHLPASNKIHFFAPGSSTKGGKDMDLFDRFAGND